MASPQVENGFLRIANEIWDEIIRRDFSKRQTAILHFIWRLSYGCKSKFAYVPQLKDFEICGVGRTNIKKELIYLESCKVIQWDRDNNYFTFNKDYERWQVSPVKGWDDEEYKKIVHQNLMKKSYQNDNPKVIDSITDSYQNDNQQVIKTITQNDDSYQNDNSLVIKTITDELSKQELEGVSNYCHTTVEEGSKDSIKNNIKDNVVVVLGNPHSSFNEINSSNPTVSRQEYRMSVGNKYLSLRAKGTELSALDEDIIFKLMNLKIPLTSILEGLEKAFRDFKPKHSQDRINSLSYCFPIIVSYHESKQKQMNQEELESPPDQQSTTETVQQEDDPEYLELLAQMKSCTEE